MAVAYCEFVRSDTPLRGFQSQTWESGRQKLAASKTRIFGGRCTIALVGKIEPARFRGLEFFLRDFDSFCRPDS